jgi:cytoskeletal protein CcmA (bactofilin family)
MGRWKIFSAILLVCLLVILGWVRIAKAQSFHSGNTVSLTQKQTIDDTVFAAGRTVDINSTINGDIFCAGQNITIAGTINGDVICAGQTINVSGTVNGDVRLAGQTVTLNAKVSGNATIASQTFTLDPGGSVARDLTLGTTTSTLNGSIGRDVIFGGGNLVVASTVGRNIKASVNELTLASNAKVNGDVNYTSTNDLKKDSGAVVAGSATRTAPTKKSAGRKLSLIGFSIFFFIYWLLALLATGIVLVLLFPRAVHAVSNRAWPAPWWALLTGFIASFAVPIVLTLLAATIIGLPLAIIGGLLWVVALILSGPMFSYYIGRLVLRDSRNVLLIMLVGSLILVVLDFIPILGFFVFLAAVWIGTGMLLLEVFHLFSRPVYNLPTNSTKVKVKSRQ